MKFVKGEEHIYRTKKDTRVTMAFRKAEAASPEATKPISQHATNIQTDEQAAAKRSRRSSGGELVARQRNHTDHCIDPETGSDRDVDAISRCSGTRRILADGMDSQPCRGEKSRMLENRH